MNLKQLQTSFQNVILSQDCTDVEWVKTSHRTLSSSDRLNIYHNAYRFRLADVLFDTFEHTAIYLGSDWFNQLALCYVQSHHSNSPNLGQYGKKFPGFLAEQFADDMEISEIALMDWRLRRAFDGPDSSVMTVDCLPQLASEDNGDLLFKFVPTLGTIRQYFNTLEIWHAIDEDRIPPAAERLPQPVDILIWRKDYSPHFRSITPIESSAISAVCSGEALEVIGTKLEEEFPDVDVATEFGGMLHRWIEDQIIAEEVASPAFVT